MKANANGNQDWKINDKNYIRELQKMFDIIENVTDEELRNRIIIQYLKCDKIITELAEKLIT